jgi:hypothetical protein
VSRNHLSGNDRNLCALSGASSARPGGRIVEIAVRMDDAHSPVSVLSGGRHADPVIILWIDHCDIYIAQVRQ